MLNLSWLRHKNFLRRHFSRSKNSQISGSDVEKSQKLKKLSVTLATPNIQKLFVRKFE